MGKALRFIWVVHLGGAVWQLRAPNKEHSGKGIKTKLSLDMERTPFEGLEDMAAVFWQALIGHGQ